MPGRISLCVAPDALVLTGLPLWHFGHEIANLSINFGDNARISQLICRIRPVIAGKAGYRSLSRYVFIDLRFSFGSDVISVIRVSCRPIFRSPSADGIAVLGRPATAPDRISDRQCNDQSRGTHCVDLASFARRVDLVRQSYSPVGAFRLAADCVGVFERGLGLRLEARWSARA